MRLITIEDVRNISPNNGAESTYLIWIKHLHDTPLAQFIETGRYYNISAVATDLHLRLNHERYQRKLLPYEFHKLYTFLLCYLPSPPHPYKNVMHYMRDHWDKCKELVPDFSLLREWCHTYIYSKTLFFDNAAFENVLSIAPYVVKRYAGTAAYNKYLLSFIRPSEVNTDNFSYVPDDNHLYKDVQVSTSIGRIIPRVVENSSVANEVLNNIVGASTKLKIAKTAEEITRVYNKGPRSCMKGLEIKVEGYDIHLNPAAVYNTDNVGVIYCERGGTITGRAVVNKQTRQYARYYGDNYFYTALRQAGYTEDEDCLHNCFIKNIPLGGNYNSTILMPFIDGSVSRFQPVGEGLIKLSHDGEYCSEETSGICNLETGNSGEQCSHCEEYYNPDHMEDVDGGFWCENCVENDAVHAWVSLYNQYLVPAYLTSIVYIDDEYFISASIAQQHGWRVTIDGEWEHEDFVFHYEGDYYTEEQLKEYDLKLNEDNEVIRDDVEDEAA